MPEQTVQEQIVSQEQIVPYEELMTWRSRMFLIRITPFLYIVSLATSVAFYLVTKDWHYFLLSSPTMLFPAVFRLIPMDERRYNLKKAKIEAREQVKQIKMLEEKIKKLEKFLSQQQTAQLLEERVKKLEKAISEQHAARGKMTAISSQQEQ